ncbi:hypothetical protein Bca4012_053736 [Brassica carinata]
MADHTNLSHRFFLSIALLSTVAAVTEPDLTGELVSLRSSSESGVIRLNDESVSRFITSVSIPRPYSLIIFFNSINLNSEPLQEFRREFGFVSASFTSNNNNRSDVTDKLFFCEIDSTDSEAFHRFGIRSLPQICLVDPSMENLQDEKAMMEEDDVDGTAESVAEFVESRTHLTVGPIHRPPLLSKTQISVIATLIAISAPFLIKKVLKGETVLHNSRVWLYGAVFVYFFSVSGTMHNIIKSVPLFLTDREDSNKLVFFYEGSQYQLGAEGFSVGFLYNAVGLLLAYVTNALVRVRNVNEQRVVMMLVMVVSLLAVKRVVYLDNWKIGTVDSQPSSMAGGCGGILVFVSGSIQLHGEDRPLRFSQIGAGQEALLGKKVLPLCHRECMPICMKVTEATQEICDGACQAGCVQLQGRGTGLSATDQGVDMVIA